jgi:hypothetical protein
MSDGPRSRRPVEIKEGDGSDAGGEDEISRPLRPTRSSRPPRVESSAPPSRRSRTPKPPGVTPKPPAVTPKPPSTVSKPPGATPKPPAVKTAAKSKAKPSSRSRKKVDARHRLDSHAEGFFAEGERTSQAPAYDDEVGPPVDSIFSVARRQTLMRYVYVALAVSTILCVIAITRTLATAPAHEATTVAPSAIAEPAAPAAPAASLTFPMPSASASAAPTPASAAAPIADAAVAPPEVPTKSASEEKADAQRALDRGKAKDAIEAASRSTTLDPSDADAWLLLGAADMEVGKAGDARAAFAACAKQATKGQVGECRSMLR